jgi:hypothetical protein
MKRLGVPKGNVKAAVLDTGFDESANKSRMNSIQFQSVQTFPHTTPKGKDYGGHGTAVAGFFGADGGIGLAPGAALTVYSITEPAGEGASEQDLRDAIERACDDGNEIINLSFGSDQDERTSVRGFKANDELVQKLEKKGCLVVKAGGNDGQRDRFETDGKVLPLMTVEAISKQGVPAGFSTVGEVSAPGARVFTLASADQSKIFRPEDRCGGGQFINGTSFASPIAAAVASNVLAILKTSPQFTQLKGPERLGITKQIMRESMVGPSINGLRAVLLAHAWTKQQSAARRNPMEVKKEWIKSGLQVLECDTVSKPCQTLPLCSEAQASCINEKKAKMSRCEPPRPEDIEDFLGTIFGAGYAEMGGIWMQRLSHVSGVTLPENLILAFKARLLASVNAGKAPTLENLENYGTYVRLTEDRLPEVEKALDQRVTTALRSLNSESDSYRDHIRETRKLVEAGIWSGKRIQQLVFEEKLTSMGMRLVLESMNVDGFPDQERMDILKKVTRYPEKSERQKARLDGVAEALISLKRDSREVGPLLKDIAENPLADGETLLKVVSVPWDNIHQLGDIRPAVIAVAQSPKLDLNTAVVAANFLADPRLKDADAERIAQAIFKKAQTDRSFYVAYLGGLMSLVEQSISKARAVQWPVPKRSEQTYERLLLPLISAGSLERNDELWKTTNILDPNETRISLVATSALRFSQKKQLLQKLTQGMNERELVFPAAQLSNGLFMQMIAKGEISMSRQELGELRGLFGKFGETMIDLENYRYPKTPDGKPN